MTAPVLVLLGGSDAVVSPERQHDMAQKPARHEEVLFFAEGHMLPHGSPATAAREILTFLDEDRHAPSVG